MKSNMVVLILGFLKANFNFLQYGDSQTLYFKKRNFVFKNRILGFENCIFSRILALCGGPLE